ncbi:MAG: response regulator [Sphingomonadales bacterium]|nr:response regulator [Sphingomonadales bacterium]NCQ21678.1 response regulator [Sphingomonadales bacterium]NCT04390.1 response regulator [Sphingomonadales bacterium]
MSEPILIVEDEFFIAFEMKSILERHGYEVCGIAADLDAAMTQAEKGVALALVDLHLRDGLTGPEVGARLSSEFNAAVLFVTANPLVLGDGVAGTVGVINKPAESTSLLSAVSYALDRRRGHTQEAPECIRCFT